MEYALAPDNRNASDNTLLQDVRDIAAKLGTRTITMRQYAGRGRFGAETIRRRFGSWNRAIALAGLDVKHRWRIPDEVLFANLDRVWRTLGRQPRRSDLDGTETAVSKSVYEQRFGSWRKALEAFVAYVEAARGQFLPNAASPEPTVSARAMTCRGPRSANWRLRFLVLRRDNFRCRACGRSTSDGIKLNVDHIRAWSRGGDTELGNLQTLCDKCNGGKSDLEWTEEQ